jgi:hypothetical protein
MSKLDKRIRLLIRESDDQDIKLFMLTPTYLKIKNQSDGVQYI